MDYTFDIVPGPKVQVLAEGFKIRRGVLKQNVPIFEENAVDEDLLNEGRRNLLNYLQTRGYFDAKSWNESSIRDTAGNELQIVYVVDAGARHRLVKIEFTGEQVLLDRAVCCAVCRCIRPRGSNRAAATARHCSPAIFMALRIFTGRTDSNRSKSPAPSPMTMGATKMIWSLRSRWMRVRRLWWEHFTSRAIRLSPRKSLVPTSIRRTVSLFLNTTLRRIAIIF